MSEIQYLIRLHRKPRSHCQGTVLASVVLVDIDDNLSLIYVQLICCRYLTKMLLIDTKLCGFIEK